MIEIYNLQLFADGEGSEGTAETPLATETNGSSSDGLIASTGNDNPGETLEGFDELIKGKYKTEFDAKVKGILNKRFKENADRDAEFNRLKDFANTASKRYGTTEGDYDALTNAFIEDDMYLEREAMEKGLDKDTLREMKKLQHENDVMKRKNEAEALRQRQEEAVRQITAEVEKVRAIYPNFDLDTERQNPNFDKLCRNGVDIKTAYEVVHRDEILPVAMQTAVTKTKENISKAIQSGSMRPTEGAASSSVTPSAKLNPATMSKAEREEIRRRVMRGEKITF